MRCWTEWELVAPQIIPQPRILPLYLVQALARTSQMLPGFLLWPPAASTSTYPVFLAFVDAEQIRRGPLLSKAPVYSA